MLLGQALQSANDLTAAPGRPAKTEQRGLAQYRDELVGVARYLLGIQPPVEASKNSRA